MDPIGFTQCTFFINGHSFTQKFIVCTNQTRPVILGKDFAARNCIGVIWTKQGSRRMVDDCNTTIMEVFEQTKDVPLSLANPIRIPPRSVVVALVECNRPLHAHMDIKGDAGFLREYPNIHVSRTYVNELPESSNCMPFSFTNLSMHSQYLGKDKVVGFAESTTDEVEVHELADYDEIKEMMRGPRNHISRKTQAKYKLPAVPIDNAFLTSPADIPGPRKVDKLDSIRDMPTPCNSKEVKQFLGLIGYYRKFVPCFAAISRPLSKLTCKDKVFEWTKECEKAFATLKEKLCAQPILQYADTTKGYTLYTDASKYGWAGVLTQLHTTVIDGKTITTDHPVAYVSGLFRGSQINWAALTKEAYAIYMSVKKLSFYLTDAEVLLKSDHLPLKKFLQKNTLNNKVNNWAMELKAFNIKFQHVSGKTNILADTLSCLVDIDPDARLDPVNAGWEFGYYVFETLPKLSSEEIASVCEVLSGTNIILPDADLQEPFTQILTSPLTNDQLQALQAQDEKCTSLTAMLRCGKLDPLVYSMNDGVLHRRVI